MPVRLRAANDFARKARAAKVFLAIAVNSNHM
jgi:hypothetical protein